MTVAILGKCQWPCGVAIHCTAVHGQNLTTIDVGSMRDVWQIQSRSRVLEFGISDRMADGWDSYMHISMY
jgi:hypothetical protein